MKLFIVGFDGATFDLIKPWAEAGHLPNLKKLLDQGTHGDLLSTLPPVTSPAWPTFMTGCNPGKHGVFDFIQPHGDNFTLVNSSRIKQPTLWQRLSKAGYRVGVMNVPVTYPPHEVNGFLITGLLSPREGQISHPADLISRHQSEMMPYRVAPNVQYKSGIEQEFKADMYDLLRTRGEWGLKLLHEENPDVLMVHFLAMDVMKHALWRFMDHNHPRFEPSEHEHAIRDGYAIVDEYIGRFLAELPPDGHVIIMSDHGFGPLHNMVNLNVFFMQKGLLKLKRDVWTQLKALAFRLGITPSTAYQWVARLGLQNMVAKVDKSRRNNIVGKFLSFDSVDWSRTTAYSMGHVGQVYLNVAGREQHGIVNPADYETTIKRVMTALDDLKDKNGRSLVTKIIRGSDAYDGPFANKGPDLHLILDDYNMIACPLFATEGKVLTQQIRGDSGCHRAEGILLALGPKIKQGETLPPANILDLAPTIMHLLGEPVPPVMDGEVLQGIFKEPWEIVRGEDEETAVVNDQNLSDAESAEVEDRLRSLGYL